MRFAVLNPYYKVLRNGTSSLGRGSKSDISPLKSTEQSQSILGGNLNYGINVGVSH